MIKIGEKRYELTVTAKIKENNRIMCVCLCDCGRTTKIISSNFGRTKRCGKCFFGSKHAFWKGFEEISGEMWSQIQKNSSSRNIEFNITIEQAWKKFQEQEGLCAITDEKIFFGKSRKHETTASLDRIDSRKGYTIDNIQWVHKKINQLKWDLSEEELVSLCQKVLNMNNKEIPLKLHFKDVHILPNETKLSSRDEVSLDVFNGGIPIIAANLDTVGCFRMAIELARLNLFTCLHKYYDLKDIINFYNSYNSIQNRVFYSFGIRDQDFEKLKKLKNEVNLPLICLDTPNGYMDKFADKIAEAREIYPQSIILAGNICTPQVMEKLFNAGADIIKVGIASGGLCMTKNKTGISYPQFSAVQECSQVAKEFGKIICSDGGCREPSDVAKAFAGGAGMVMVGSILGGAEECEGEWEYMNAAKIRIKMYGMSSKECLDKYYGGVGEYRASEGDCKWVEYKGRVEDIVKDILGGLRSVCTYCDAKNLSELSSKTTFVRSEQ